MNRVPLPTPPLPPGRPLLVVAGFMGTGKTAAGRAAADLLERDPDPSDEAVREALSGNLCRCTGYQKIVDAVRLAASRAGGGA